MDTIKKFIASHSALAHTLVVVWGFLTGFYFENATAHAYINSVATAIYHSAPHWLQGAIIGLIIPLITYWKTKKGTSVTTTADAPSTITSTTKIGVIALCFLLLSVSVTGCTQQQKISVAQEIVNWTPTIVSTASTVASTVALLDPASAAIIAAAVSAFDVAAAGVKTAAADYLANPSASTLTQLQTFVVQFQQSVNSSLLSAVKITNQKSQAAITAAINALAVGINAVLALVQTISSSSQIVAMQQRVTIHLAQVRPYMDQNALQVAALQVSSDLHITVTPNQFFDHEAQMGF